MTGGSPGASDPETDDPERIRGRLLLDVMLGKLATYLRMCGFDAAYALDRGVEADNRILGIARSEGRTLLTRDRRLANRRSDSVLLTSKDIDDQLRELRAAGFRLELDDSPTRCGRCNGRVEPVEGTTTADPAGAGRAPDPPDYAPDPAAVDCWRCRECDQWFWKGSHWDDVAARLDGLDGE
ncbi:Mut7-C RNAse domain-containing protein [Halorientalis marina]|jgi:uncharacterized protein with PIN domain|uniref:Mut7-C RNAse domain-containing protein n=1 Tax=Halorientalis marina TaxID=2931976 RepID=UPI00211145DA|nr:Mut7-C RNAse domain-containing protein [Halorientalis marina]